MGRTPTKGGHDGNVSQQGNFSQKQVVSAVTNSWKFGPSITASDIMGWFNGAPERID